MRVPQDMTRERRGPSRAQLILVGVVVIAIVLLLSLKGLAVFFTDYLWFSNYHLGEVWSGVLLAKVELWVVFAAIYLAGALTSMVVAQRQGLRQPADHDDELVQRYRAFANRRRWVLPVVLAVVTTLIVASQAPAEWKNWLLFGHSESFPMRDPEFHVNVGFYVFRLPFIEFLISWFFLAAAFTFVLTAVVGYLTGSIQPQRREQRVAPSMKAHLSVLLAVMALIKAIGYYFQRYQLDFSTRGFVEGASYTDVHAQLPAINLLIFISAVACVLFVINIFRQGWVLPVIGLGLWAFISIVLGAIYPAIIQKFVVDPAQGQKELPYIARNIAATRYAYDIADVPSEPYSATANTSSSVEQANLDSLGAARLWGTSTPQQTFGKLQAIRSYYQFPSLSIENDTINGKPTPVIIGVRELNAANLPAQSWVNQHLQFTHGYGVALAPANEISAAGNPIFLIRDLPPTSSGGAPTLTQPQVYYGQGLSGYVIADSRQAEIDYQLPDGASSETHYAGSGGVRLSSLLVRAAFAMRFGDINILVSSLLTTHSRIMFERDLLQRVEMAMPVLHYGSNPYPVIVDGHIDWVINGYTTTANFPYSEQANTQALSSSAPLANTSFNYVRNSVKVVVNAYTGAMHFYVTDPSDPIIQAYEAAFPHVFQPVSAMPAAIASHLRYPSDLLAVQSAMYGIYHVTNPSTFYSGGNAWSLSAQPQNGSISSGSSFSFGGTSQNLMSPIYEMAKVPGTSSPQLALMEAFVPFSQSGGQQNLTGLLFGEASASDPTQLVALTTPSSGQIDGPALVASRIVSATNVSQEITLLDQHGSNVSLGGLTALPLGQNLLWVRPMYVSSQANPLPEIKEVIGVYGTQVAMEPTFAGVLRDIFGVVPSGVQGSSRTSTTATVPSSAAGLLAKADQLYSEAQAALKSGNLGAYQSDIEQIGQILSELKAASVTGKAAG
ncbi:protein of unknown function UPF0182 [Acidimicrobium ferrooxidans DSM 10331]|uniref:Uncharacterized protein n=1 Tax=Acidimicrobium ferrooxidans (strain DSM 10331 / JCM 15462 / NBRC 103882 / ICP) TaxID=525909 RepID=C7M1D4_ACIFD|nr:UPF0182 family protein [Acidimicrobium ferrooxidans]ACU54782.1 protein of unknown function UPF0182 [Acidimicrobium ferrooxidans DSM 10331]